MWKLFRVLPLPELIWISLSNTYILVKKILLYVVMIKKIFLRIR